MRESDVVNAMQEDPPSYGALEPPSVHRQNAYGPAPFLWSEMAEEDAEMRIMGPPPVFPDWLNRDEWVEPSGGWEAPKKTCRAQTPAPIQPFLTQDNYFTMLHQLDEPTPPGEAIAAAWAPPPPIGPSPLRQASSHSSGPATAPSTSSLEAPRSPSPTPPPCPEPAASPP